MASLRSIRKAAGFTQKALADRAGLSIAAVSRVERSPLLVQHVRTQTMIAKALNVDVRDIDEFISSPADEPAVIYAICDPKSGRPRYVGQTARGTKTRLEQHLQDCQKTNGKSHLHAWLKRLIDNGELPMLSVLETTTVGDATERERWWMTHLREQGEDLLNTALFQRPANWTELQARRTEKTAKREADAQAWREKREANPELQWRASPARRPRMSPEDIIAFRNRHQLSQKELAQHLGYNHSTISYWESGRRLPPPGLNVLLQHVEDTLKSAGIEDN